MSGYLQLPTDETALAESIRMMTDAALMPRSMLEMEWCFVH